MSGQESAGDWLLKYGDDACFMLTVARVTEDAEKVLFWEAVIEALLEVACAAHIEQGERVAYTAHFEYGEGVV